ncbi:MAG: tRNA 2-thiocytidine biosynthesis protein TtcA [Lachnospiraceae bacterium]|nr:tRNA 2-thiocytidine biosynthesis protein TtcA [Lachnospiraceae bacterium]
MQFERREKAQRSIIKTYRSELWTKFIKAIKDYDLIQDGDKIAVCVSGGKDSMLMAMLFKELYLHGKKNFELAFLSMDPGYSRENFERIRVNADILGIPLEFFESSIFEIVEKNEKSPCYPCARMRRGALYAHGKALGCNKIALGHHFDDVIETILMGMLYAGQIQTMMPKLHSTNFPGMELIRPLYLVREEDIIRWRDYNDLTFIACACKLTEKLALEAESNDCFAEPQGPLYSKRAEIKNLIRALRKKNEFVEANIFKSVENVHVDTVIKWKKDGISHSFLDEYE